MQRYEVEQITLVAGAAPVVVVSFNTLTFNSIEIFVSGGDVLRMSDDCTGGLLIKDGQRYILSPTDYLRTDPRGDEVQIKMKAAGETDVTLDVSKSYVVGV